MYFIRVADCSIRVYQSFTIAVTKNNMQPPFPHPPPPQVAMPMDGAGTKWQSNTEEVQHLCMKDGALEVA